MYSLIFISIILLLQSCSSTVEKYSKNDFKNIKSLNAISDTRKTILSQMAFIKAYYEPNRDPYSGTFKISLDCAKKNIFEDIQTDDSAIYMLAHIFLTKNDAPGACPDTPDSKNVIYVVYSCNNNIIQHGYFLKKQSNSLEHLGQILCK